ncbi:unnamed protein product [Cyprideis torosa]|uniref:palmitoyl-protein hydrolase n=1 Tax=Cyprideis torosa TaxID=163714 RepID=A0A7R8ZXY7_9CRUS|nr:unnamed protein product [Cyprideis torosa]CAG0910811.1 unnamed protein product [Cyprideis torosa]
MTLLPAVTRDVGKNIESAVVWLHGLGADGNDFVPIIDQLDLGGASGVRFVFPHAPSIPVTINGGVVMPAWYDICDMELDRSVDEAGLLDSASSVALWLDELRGQGIASERILLAGFSQGGAVACHLGLSYPCRLGGLILLSTYFAGGEKVQGNVLQRGLNVFIGHGLYDPVVPVGLATEAIRRLEELGLVPRYHEYAMEHCVCEKEIEDISSWIRERLL